MPTYADLKTDVIDWMARGELSGSAGKFIMLAEAHLNREIPAVELDTVLAGTPDSRDLDISALSVESPISLFLIDPNTSGELELTEKAPGTFAYQDISGRPRYWAKSGDTIRFDCPVDQPYGFRFWFRQKFALSDAAPTNWLLTNHYDVYLAASIVWGGVYVRGQALAATHTAILDSAIPSLKTSIARSKRARLTVDPALQAISRRIIYTGTFQ